MLVNRTAIGFMAISPGSTLALVSIWRLSHNSILKVNDSYFDVHDYGMIGPRGAGTNICASCLDQIHIFFGLLNPTFES